MKYLLYGVFRHCKPPLPITVQGVGREPVFLIEKNGLSAAVSKVEDSQLTADLSGVRAYEKVIEFIHRERTVIPLRFGSWFDSKSQAAGFLEEHHKHYMKLLTELEGSAEMSVRILLKDAERLPETAPRSGAAYLEAERKHFADLDQIDAEQQRISRDIHALLSGLVAKSKSEPTVVEGFRQLALYFLISRKSVNRFRKAIRRLEPCPPAKLFLSGPWPPHNFVS